MTHQNVNRSDTGRTRNRVQLTDAIVRAAGCIPGRTHILYDCRVSGFGVRVTPAGHKAFILNYTVAGRERRYTIGAYPAWTVAAARDEAARLRRGVDVGDDPLERREADRAASTLSQLWKRYEIEVSAHKSPSTHRNERSIWRRFILPELGARKLATITASDCERLHKAISRSTPIQANRMLASLRHAFNKARFWGLAETNPTFGVGRNAERARERYLDSKELQFFVAALDARVKRSSALALKFILLTGCRRGEALGATWDQFDLQTGVWTKPGSQTKQRRVHRVPLSPAAQTILTLAAGRSPDVVFPGRTGKPLVELKKVFAEVCGEAGVSGFRIHDLRHTFASYLASSGVDIVIVGKLLGHSQLSTTQRYAHLFDDPLRKAATLMSDAMQRGAHAVQEGEL